MNEINNTKYPQLYVLIKKQKKAESNILIGTLVNSNRERIPGVKPISRIVSAIRDEDQLGKNIIASLEVAYEKTISSAMSSTTNEDGLEENPWEKTFYILFGKFLDIDNYAGCATYEESVITYWGESTTSPRIVYFKKHILPELKNVRHESDFTSIERNKILNKCMDVARKKMKDKDDTDIRKVAVDNMKFSDTIIAEIVYENPSLPMISLRYYERSNRKVREQVKSLPIDIHKAFELQLERLALVHPEYVRAGIVCDFAGARPAEAAAIWSGSFKYFDEFAVVTIIEQERGKAITRELKSSNGYRKVVIDKWAMQLIQECNSSIGNEKKDDPPRVSAKKLSAWLRDKLRIVGCDEDVLKQNFVNGVGESNIDDKKGDFDVATYVLRRNRASIWRNYCGYSQGELDYALGHDHGEKLQPLKSCYEAMAKKNARYNLMEEECQNPFTHYKLSNIFANGNELKLDVFTDYFIENDSSDDMKINIDFYSVEPGDEIEIEFDGNEIDRLITSERYWQSEGVRKNCYMIGNFNNNINISWGVENEEE